MHAVGAMGALGLTVVGEFGLASARTPGRRGEPIHLSPAGCKKAAAPIGRRGLVGS